MTGAFPIDQILSLRCPIARTFAGEVQGGCRGKGCTLLREAPMVTDAAWIAAVQAHAEAIEDKTPTRVKAAREVARDPEAHGLVRRYFCGLGGAVS